MQLDFQQFLMKLEKLTDIRPIPDKEFVETYISSPFPSSTPTLLYVFCSLTFSRTLEKRKLFIQILLNTFSVLLLCSLFGIP